MTKPLYFYNGTTFELVGPTTPQSPIAYQTSAPTAPATGDLWIDSDGDVDTYNRQLTRYYFVATAGQTSVTGVDANGLTLAYVAGSEAVYVNGALQVRGQDYTATNGTSITGLSALALNDVVEVFAYTAFTVANAYTKTETDGLVGTSAGLKLLTPTSVAVGSGSASASTTGTVTFSGVSSVSLNGCFSSAYNDYKIIIHKDTVSTANSLSMRLRASGTDLSSSSYNLLYNAVRSSNTVQTGYGTGTSVSLGDSAIATGMSVTFDLSNPFRTVGKKNWHVWNHWGVASSENSGLFNAYYVDNTTSYDGFSLFTNTGTMTGSVSVYGYKV